MYSLDIILFSSELAIKGNFQSNGILLSDNHNITPESKISMDLWRIH